METAKWQPKKRKKFLKGSSEELVSIRTEKHACQQMADWRVGIIKSNYVICEFILIGEALRLLS